jgi:phage gpG-like protein
VEPDAQKRHDSFPSISGGRGSDLPIVKLAAIHEFGSSDGRVPARSWLGGWYDENIQNLSKIIMKVAEEMADGKTSDQNALEKIGLWSVASIQSRIKKRIPPPLKKSTIARKGSSVPLIDTGRLWQSIRHLVRDKK